MRDLLKPKNRAKFIIIIGCGILLVFLISFILWSILRGSVTESEVVILDEQNIEITMKDTSIYTELVFSELRIDVHMKSEQ